MHWRKRQAYDYERRIERVVERAQLLPDRRIDAGNYVRLVCRDGRHCIGQTRCWLANLHPCDHDDDHHFDRRNHGAGCVSRSPARRTKIDSPKTKAPIIGPKVVRQAETRETWSQAPHLATLHQCRNMKELYTDPTRNNRQMWLEITSALRTFMLMHY